MVSDGTKGSSATDPFAAPEKGHHSFSFHERGEEGKGYMETEGRGYSGLFRNTSEEIFIKSLMESPVGMPVPTKEMLGFKNLSQPFRADSEELFKSWLTNGETHGYNSTGIAHCTRQASRRISTELANLPTQQEGSTLQGKRGTDVSYAQNTTTPADDHQPMRNAVERIMQASNSYLAKAWFHSSQPMTRSRSSELRRRYVAMQNSQTNLGIEDVQNIPEHGMTNFRQEFANQNSFNDLPVNDVANHLGSFISPLNSSFSTFNAHQMGNVDRVSSVVNLLKGTLERKKLGNLVEKETVEDGTAAIYNAQESVVNSSFDDVNENRFHEIQRAFRQVSPSEVKLSGDLQTMQDPIDLDLEGFVDSMNPMQLNAVTREPSQSESSAAAPVVSSGFDVCDGPSNSSQNFSIAESSMKPAGNRASESGSRAKDFRARIIDNFKDERKRGGLVRYGSVNSAGSVDKGDPTKKRRVERSRKMAERSLTPAIPSDMQSVLKRCENLEKEVRSLKLNLSFMNRKDSEQTKQIEDLQKKNDELTDEKERLLEEIERILSET